MNYKKLVSIIVAISTIGVSYYFISSGNDLLASNLVKQKKDDKGMSVEDFQKKVANSKKVVLVYFNADWCMPCVKLKPEIIELENETKDFCETLKINSDENPKIADYFEINALPMFVIYKNGTKMWENIGALTKQQLKNKIELYK
jgi:thioredoxin